MVNIYTEYRQMIISQCFANSDLIELTENESETIDMPHKQSEANNQYTKHLTLFDYKHK